MFNGAIADRAIDYSPDLSLEEQSIADRLSDNFVKWVDPKEIMLGMARISSYWNKLGKKLMETLESLLLETPATTTLHECLVITDPELKCAEEKLASSDDETPNSEISLHPTLGASPVVKRSNSCLFVCCCYLPTVTSQKSR
ncbi:unnamed protein product [Lactuca virosa]|uniref:Uncharacterized protein n=1 Tax=Lactuca virosa TaxID=75947 RepID=A0AAU9MZJ5_9ASTR|nr:unnamed protein product [Lactuca virosa]